MLSEVTVDSAHSLNGKHRRYLRSALSKEVTRGYMNDNDSHKATAIMQCLATIEDFEARAVIESIAKWEDRGANKLIVSARARECLRILDLKQEQARTGAVLFRSCSEPGARADTLLRSANDTGVVDASQLVRAGEPGETRTAAAYEANTLQLNATDEEAALIKVVGG